MKPLLAKISRFFWSRGFLKFVLWSITLLVFLYIEENWRGARTWAATKAKWEARGETFDANNLIPPPVPDDQNLATLPLFKLSPDPNDKSQLAPLALDAAIHIGSPPGMPYLRGNWQMEESIDLPKLRADVAAEYASVFGQPPGNKDALAQFDLLYPFVAQLNTAAADRPRFRLPIDYAYTPIYALPISVVSDGITVTRILSEHALLALDQHHPEIALTDMHTILRIEAGLAREPMLISGLVANAIINLGLVVVHHGLATQAWNDDQLATLESELGRVDALTGYQTSMRGELFIFTLKMFVYLKHERPLVQNLFGDNGKPPPLIDTDPIFRVWPGGWIDLNCSRATDTLLGAVALVDPKAHRVQVAPADEMLDKADRFAATWAARMPWNIFSAITLGPVLNATVQFSHAQVWTDEACIACALSRYHFLHGSYPATLGELTPQFIETVPRDPMNGEPYHYQVKPDGTFLLYSVGWNQADDGGKAVFSLPPAADEHDSPQKHGDWVWPAR